MSLHGIECNKRDTKDAKLLLPLTRAPLQKIFIDDLTATPAAERRRLWRVPWFILSMCFVQVLWSNRNVRNCSYRATQRIRNMRGHMFPNKHLNCAQNFHTFNFHWAPPPTLVAGKILLFLYFYFCLCLCFCISRFISFVFCFVFAAVLVWNLKYNYFNLYFCNIWRSLSACQQAYN